MDGRFLRRNDRVVPLQERGEVRAIKLGKLIQKVAEKTLKTHKIMTPYSLPVRIRLKQSTHSCNFDF